MKSLKISEFAQLTGLSRKTLIFYDKAGLLHPEYVAQNQYRYYSYRQVDTANVISSLRETGMSLHDIKSYLDRRSPQNMLALFQSQREIVEGKIAQLKKIRDMIDIRLQYTRNGIAANTDAVYVRSLPEEYLFLGPRIPPLQNPEDEWHYLPDFYEYGVQHGYTYGLPVGSLVSNKNLLGSNYTQPTRFFYRLFPQQVDDDCYTKPAGDYMIGYDYADYGQNGPLYRRLLQYAKTHGLTISGHAYEEYLLDEIASANPDRYLLQIVIGVKL